MRKEYDEEQADPDVDYIIDEKANTATLTKPGGRPKDISIYRIFQTLEISLFWHS